MSAHPIDRLAQRELKYQFQREVSREIRNHCPKGDPMATGITVMLGTILVMAAFNRILNGNHQDRTR